MKSLLFAAGTALLITGTAVAQDTRLTRQEATEFLEPLGEQAKQAVRQGDWQGITKWMQQHVADDAPVAIRGSFLATTGSTMSFQLTLSGAELQRFAGMTMGRLDRMLDAIRDYQIKIDVLDVTELPTGDVNALIPAVETGVLKAGPGNGGANSVAFHATTSCTLRLGSAGDGDPEIRLAGCELMTTM